MGTLEKLGPLNGLHPEGLNLAPQGMHLYLGSVPGYWGSGRALCLHHLEKYSCFLSSSGSVGTQNMAMLNFTTEAPSREKTNTRSVNKTEVGFTEKQVVWQPAKD